MRRSSHSGSTRREWSGPDMLADENVPRGSVEYLREQGYDVVWIAEVNPGVDDQVVLVLGRAQARLTFGFDLDLPERIVRGTDAPPISLVLLWCARVTDSDRRFDQRLASAPRCGPLGSIHWGEGSTGSTETISARPMMRVA